MQVLFLFFIWYFSGTLASLEIFKTDDHVLFRETKKCISWDFIFKFRKKDNKNTYKNTTLYSAQFVDYLVWCLYEWCSGHGMPWQPLATQVEKEIRNTKYKMWVEKVEKKRNKKKINNNMYIPTDITDLASVSDLHWWSSANTTT